MNDDEFQRQVDLIVGQQAKFETNIARLEEDIAGTQSKRKKTR